jgi:hypothetical protein
MRYSLTTISYGEGKITHHILGYIAQLGNHRRRRRRTRKEKRENKPKQTKKPPLSPSIPPAIASLLTKTPPSYQHRRHQHTIGSPA